MKKNVFALLAACALIPVLTGCYATLDGRVKPGVVPFAKDTIESRYERSVSEIFEAAIAVLNDLGNLVGENRIKNTLEAKIDTRTVWVAVDDVEPKISRVRVQVRKKGGGADIDLASELDKQIALRLPR